MRKNREKLKKNMWKNSQEAKFEQMVSEYHSAKATLDTLEKDSAEYAAQNKHCDSLFAKAERFFKQHQ
ncbi:hypothetical protein ACPV4B_09810 [Vibrio parahaemolyticus]|uniref:Uncharacterized protein n=1 Tax=Vibrio hangzhouensis TaxID=462991 RepID=A0A1H5ZQH1_9VIBR|nr:hypothetical protein [Vibrio hangzhouensis]SEG38452.1 hypothetical protein SAMN04488244_112123 [Vibrio hangzhouensis]